MNVSVVVPTCNRRERLLSLLDDLNRSRHPISEILVVDSSDDPLNAAELARFRNAPIEYVGSTVKSVCAQRNIGIERARGTWIFLCDDDIEVPPDYLATLAGHIGAHPEAGAVSGLVLEMAGGDWKSGYPVTSPSSLLWRFLFQLGIWGEIEARGLLVDAVVERYRRLGNHISRAGWPVMVDFSPPYVRTPIYALGASVIRREWLLRSPYDERLDPHGMGDHYGVAIGFPSEGIHVVTDAFVRHHKDRGNRLADDQAYARRLLALHYFIRSRPELAHVRETFFLWSLLGQLTFHAATGNRALARAALATLSTVIRGKNPYLARAVLEGER